MNLRLAMPIQGCVLLIAFVRALPAQQQDSAAAAALVPALLAKYHVPGAAVAIIRGQASPTLAGFGYARLPDSLPVDPERTVFRIASVAKTFVAVAAMQQVERGALQLDVDVNRYLTRLKLPAASGRSATLGQLLTHSAGFDERFIGYLAGSIDSIHDLAAHLAARLPARGWAPGTVTGYSNYGFALAAHLVETRTGVSFDRYAADRIFLPLGMRRTSYITPAPASDGDLARGYRCEETGCVEAGTVISRPYPAGLAYSTASDLARFARALLSGGTGILDSSAATKLLAQHFSNDPRLPGMSYAFFNQQWRTLRVLAHAGSVPGFRALLLLVPQADLGLVILSNSDENGFGSELRDSLLARLLPATPLPTAPSRRFADLRGIAGTYQLTRYSHSTIERFIGLFSTASQVSVSHDTLFAGGTAYLPVDSTLFRSVDGEALLALRRNSRGKVTHLFRPLEIFGARMPAAYERLAWHNAPGFMNEYVSWLMMLPLLILVGWPIVAVATRWLRRRNGGQHPAAGRLPWLAVAVLFTFGTLFVWFGFGFVAGSVRQAQSLVLGLGMPPVLMALTWIPWVLVPLGLSQAALAGMAWRENWWDPVRRTAYTVAASAGLLTLGFLWTWNYLPLRW